MHCSELKSVLQRMEVVASGQSVLAVVVKTGLFSSLYIFLGEAIFKDDLQNHFAPPLCLAGCSTDFI